MSLLPRPQMPRSPMSGGRTLGGSSSDGKDNHDYYDYQKWGATDWRKWLPESAAFTRTISKPFQFMRTVSANGYDLTYDPQSRYITDISKGGQKLDFGNREDTGYAGAGLLDPRLMDAVTNWKKTPDKIDDYLADLYKKNPQQAAIKLGQINARGTVNAGSADSTAYRPEIYWGNQLGVPSAQQFWNNNMSAAAQSAADDPDDGFLGGLGQLVPMALMLIPGFQALAPWAQGAIMGGSGALLSGGDPLKGAALGGLGGWAGGAVGGSAFAKANPMLGRAASAGVRGLISSGGNVESALGSALTGGISAGISPHLGDFKWAASPLASVASAAIRGKPITPQSIALSTAGNLIRSTNAPRQATIKGVKQ